MTGRKSAPDDPRGVLWELSRHLPPSAAQLTVLDVGGQVGAQLVRLRPDVRVISVHTSPPTPLQTMERGVVHVCAEDLYVPFRDGNFDAVTRYSANDTGRDQAAFLHEALRVLRPGGRLILIDPVRRPRGIFRGLGRQPGDTLEQWASVLNDAGFARVLAERIADGKAVLSRGEKPYPALSPAERIAHTAELDEESSGLQSIDSRDLPAIGRGRFVFLLVRQTPDKPPWAIQSGEPIRWDAAMVSDQADTNRPYLLGFTSLPKAVEFMQPAVTAGLLKGINKVAKFDKSVAPQWAADVLLNPPFEALRASDRYRFSGALMAIDPRSAVTGEE